MRSFRDKFMAALAIVLMICLSIGSVVAAKENYTYTVTFYAGTQGEFASLAGLSVDGDRASVTQSADQIVITGLETGDRVSFNAQSAVDLDAESKHYVQGVRLSGRDNNEVSASTFTVDSDEDYVVAYGIKGNVVGYSVYYQDADGNELMEEDVFYGNVGDKPVVAYKYIEGYEPQVLGFTKTLSENEADNVFIFVYDEVEVNEVIQEVQGGGNGADGNAGAGNGANAGADEDAAAVDGNAGADEDANVQDGAGADEDAAADGNADDEIVDLDDEETPLANVDADNGGKGIPMAGMIAILIIALVALANAGFFVKRRMQKK